jgi:hypothetical protein
LYLGTGDKLLEVETRMADLGAVRDNLRAALDAGCDDLHQCATTDCCPLPFVEITTRRTRERQDQGPSPVRSLTFGLVVLIASLVGLWARSRTRAATAARADDGPVEVTISDAPPDAR